jgi:urease accessory protein
MTATERSKPGDGHIRLEMVGKRAELTKLQSAYPLKLLSPKSFSLSQRVVYILSFGGGMLSNDSVNITVEILPNMTLTLLSQASTKIFKRKQSGHQAQQNMIVRLGSKSLLALLPEPVTCFQDACYKQTQDFYLEESSSLLLLDWMTAGRSSRGEMWEFHSYQSTSSIYIDNELFIRDAWLLQSTDNDLLFDRMRGYECIANLVVYGPKLVKLQEDLLKFNLLNKIEKGTGVRDVVWSLSKIQWKSSPYYAIVMRIVAKSTSQMREFILDRISGIDDDLGKYFSRI